MSNIWRHVVFSTHNSWLHGDPRGFRSRDHRIHSSGDYNHRPPTGEHAGLHRYQQSNSGETVVIPMQLRATIGASLIAKMQRENRPLLVVAITPVHAHMLAELPQDPDETKEIVGRCKGYASFIVRKQMPGTIWAVGGSNLPIKDETHHENTFNYILYEQGEDAWTWHSGLPVPPDPGLRPKD